MVTKSLHAIWVQEWNVCAIPFTSRTALYKSRTAKFPTQTDLWLSLSQCCPSYHTWRVLSCIWKDVYCQTVFLTLSALDNSVHFCSGVSHRSVQLTAWKSTHPMVNVICHSCVEVVSETEFCSFLLTGASKISPFFGGWVVGTIPETGGQSSSWSIHQSHWFAILMLFFFRLLIIIDFPKHPKRKRIHLLAPCGSLHFLPS